MGDIPKYQYALYAGLSTTEFLVGTPLNLMCLVYFISKKDRTNSRFLYICINTVDVIICGLSIFTALTCYFGGAKILFKPDILCLLFGVLWNIVPRLSVFLIAVLSISRTISLIYPLRHIRRRDVVAPVVVYTVIQILQASLPYWFAAKYKYIPFVIGCGWQLSDLQISWDALQFIYVFVLPCQYILPAIPIIASCGISCSQLWAMDSQLGNSAMSGRKRQATVTIVMLTVAYAVFNIPWCLLIVGYSIGTFSGYTIDYAVWLNLSTEQLDLIDNLTFTHTVAFNSMVNAMIYFTRIKDLKTFGRSFVSRVSTKSRRRKTQTEELSMASMGVTRKRTESENTTVCCTVSCTDGKGARVRTESEGTVYENKVVNKIRNDTDHSSYESRSEDSPPRYYRSVKTDSPRFLAGARVRTSSEGSRDGLFVRRKRTESENTIHENKITVEVEDCVDRLSVQSPELGNKHFVVIPKRHDHSDC